MAYPQHIWNQLKSLESKDLIEALRKDGWEEEFKRDAPCVFRKEVDGAMRRVSIHYQPKKSYSPFLLRKLLEMTGWTEDDMKRLKLIKGKAKKKK